MNHPGYQLTEWAYSHPWLSAEAKLVLGVTLQWPGRNPSIRQLEDVLPINRHAIIFGQEELEVEGIARYERPTKRRSKTDLRYEDSNRLVWVHPKAEPNRRRPDAERRAFLPSKIADHLPRGVKGKKNAKHFPLVALVYAHAQARSGRVALQDDAVGALIGLNARQVATIRKQLLQSGLLAKAASVPRLGKTHRLVGIETNAVKLDPNKVPRLAVLEDLFPNPETTLKVIGSKSELALLDRLLDQLDAEQRSRITTDAEISEGGAGEAFAVSAAALIDAAKLRLSDPSFDRSRQHLPTVLDNVYLVPSPRPIRTVSSTQALSSTQTKRRTSREDGLRRKDQKGGHHRERQAPALRDVVPEKNLQVRAGDEVWAAITRGLDWLEEKYGKDERDGYARDWTLESGRSGKTFLKFMYARFPELKPREAAPAGSQDRSAELAAMFAESAWNNTDDSEADVWAYE